MCIRDRLNPIPIIQFTIRSEKLSAAKALPRKPARVMPTWIVARNLAGWSVSSVRRRARLSPDLLRRASLLSFIEIMDISALAKIAFIKIRNNCKRRGKSIELGNKGITS